MPDIIDDAQRAEAFVIQEALSKMPRQDTDEAQLRDDDGLVICLECGDPISLARLAKVPTATRCVECQERETLRRQFERG
jgi:phage/conjugal plasmid C-4 type zinc finger TraR family protein